MPDIPIPATGLPTPDRLGILELTARTRRYAETDPQGNVTYAAGTVSVGLVPGAWQGETFVPLDLPALRIPDITADITAAAVAGDALASEAGQRFARVMADLLWIERWKLAKLGYTSAPTPGA